MKILAYKEDGLPILIITTAFIADVIVYLQVDSVPLLVMWTILGVWPKGNIGAWSHHHQHRFFFKQSVFNRLTEVMFSLQTGITGYAWVLHHNYGHHKNFLDQKKDPSRWKDKHNKTMGCVRYTAITTLTSYYRSYKVGLAYPRYLKYFLAMTAVSLVVLVALIYYRPTAALFVFVLPMLISLTLVAYATYNHHSGLEGTDAYTSCRNIDSKWYNRITGNLGLHTAHHMRFGMHWSRLPTLHDSIKDKIPPECFTPASFDYRFMDYLDGLFYKAFAK